MPLGLITGRAFSPFSRAFSARSAAINCFSLATSPRSAATSAASSQRDRLEGSAAADMTIATSYAAASLQAKNASCPGVLPQLQTGFIVLMSPTAFLSFLKRAVEHLAVLLVQHPQAIEKPS